MISTKLTERKVGYLNIKTKMFDFEASALIGWLARVFANQPIRKRASKSDIFVFMLRWPTFLTPSTYVIIIINFCLNKYYMGLLLIDVDDNNKLLLIISLSIRTE